MMNRLILSALVLTLGHSASALDCGKEAVIVSSAWGDSTEKATQTSVNAKDNEFKSITSKGYLDISQFDSSVVIKHIVSKKTDVEVRLSRVEPNRCKISTITFGNPRFFITGSQCYRIASASKAVDDDGTGFQNPEQHNKTMLGKIRGIVPNVPESLIQRIRDNCRNRASFAQVSVGSSGKSAAREAHEENRGLERKAQEAKRGQ